MNLVIFEELPRASQAAFSLIITKANNTNNVSLLGKPYVKARITYRVKGRKSEGQVGGRRERNLKRKTQMLLSGTQWFQWEASAMDRHVQPSPQVPLTSGFR